MIFLLPPAMSTKDHQRPLRMHYLCTIKKTTAYKGPDNGVETPKQRRCFRGEKPPLPKMAAQHKKQPKMSKIIYRKVRTAPGQKQYLDANKTQVNPAFEDNAAYYVKAVSTETLSLRDMSKHISSHGSPYTASVVMGVLEAFRSCLIEQLLESKKVKIEGLGTFYVTIANKRGGEKELAKFNIGSMAVGLRLRFLPETAAEEKISQKEFLKKAKFIDVADLANIDESPTSEDGNTVVIDDGNGGENQNQNGGGTNTGDNGGGDNGGGTNGGGEFGS